MNDTTDIAFGDKQQFILDYAALCERSGLFLATDYHHGNYIDTVYASEHSSRVVTLVLNVEDDWSPELTALLLRHVGNVGSCYAHAEQARNLAKHVSPDEWTRAGGSNYDRDSIASYVRDYVSESHPGTCFSIELTRWYLHAVENDC